ncbi:uncharacterized protein THITE_2092161 [Thermothielavioides terrestris NRRL 8126]|uniref:Uncharacterized protein n=1 Tax=Thermothielavioides terrestris (strain ATCC 38088 / NRRL 8126) TaxID=578455 RepID=G2RCR5_THETT|nr:uncharacterized protein THITE_2092161 [Thermothielavioides terrestris NRRL 8126]AEO70661.1 hypothetical protein THITE_2092161 [Thermothielavioides terrestris NRRL 8126]
MEATGPFAFLVDYQVITPTGDEVLYQPASVIQFGPASCGLATLTDPSPTSPLFQTRLPFRKNNHLIIYELPTSWSKVGNGSRGQDVDVGMFADVLALFDVAASGMGSQDLHALEGGCLIRRQGDCGGYG